jgi:hypothetical protein
MARDGPELTCMAVVEHLMNTVGVKQTRAQNSHVSVCTAMSCKIAFNNQWPGRWCRGLVSGQTVRSRCHNPQQLINDRR